MLSVRTRLPVEGKKNKVRCLGGEGQDEQSKSINEIMSEEGGMCYWGTLICSALVWRASRVQRSEGCRARLLEFVPKNVHPDNLCHRYRIYLLYLHRHP